MAMSSCDAGTRDLYPKFCVRLTTLNTQSVTLTTESVRQGANHLHRDDLYNAPLITIRVPYVPSAYVVVKDFQTFGFDSFDLAAVTDLLLQTLPPTVYQIWVDWSICSVFRGVL